MIRSLRNHWNKKDRNDINNNLPEFKDSINKIFKKNEININLEEDVNLFEINLKKLNLELNRFSSFEDYLNYSIYNMDSGLVKSFVDNLNKDFQLNLNYMNIVKSKNIELNDTEKEELNKINKIIKQDKLKDGQYKQLYDAFNKNVLKFKKNENKNDIITETLKYKISSMIDNYLDIEELYKLKIQYQNYFITKGINDLDNNYNKLLKIRKKNISLQSPYEFINSFDKYMNELYNLKGDDNNLAIESLYNKFKELKRYSTKKFLSSLLLIGEYSSGKTSFINSLIGLNLLQVKSTECSKVAIIVRYTEKKENITLYSAELKENEKYGFYFIEDKLEAKGMLNVKKKIIELNKIQEFN